MNFSVPADFVLFVYLDVFCLTPFCFEEYLLFTLTFVAQHWDCLCDTF